MAATEITDGVSTTAGVSTLTYTPDLPTDSEAHIYATATNGGTATSVSGHVTAGGIVEKLSAVANRYAWTEASLTLETYGSLLPIGTNKFDGGVLAPNGKIYSVPRGSLTFMIIDTINNTAILDDLGADLYVGEDTQNWGYGGVLGDDGRIYMCPRDAPDVLIIDPVAETATREDFGLDLSDLTKWRGGVAGPNGKIYFVPANSPNILVIDVAAQTATRTNMGVSMSGGNKWLGGVLAPNGKIYCPPIETTDFLIIDTADDTATRSTMGATIDSEMRGWAGGVLGCDGLIYCCPNNNITIAIIDPSDDSCTLTDMGATITAADKWLGGAVGPDGKVYCTPFTAGTNVLVINPLAETAEVSGLGFGQLNAEWNGFKQGFDGALYGLPRNTTDTIRIASPAPALPRHMLLGRYLNKF